MGEAPIADRAWRLAQLERERPLAIRPGPQRQRFVERVAQAGVDEPATAGVGGRRQAVDGQREVAGEVAHGETAVAGPARHLHDRPQHPLALVVLDEAARQPVAPGGQLVRHPRRRHVT